MKTLFFLLALITLGGDFSQGQDAENLVTPARCLLPEYPPEQKAFCLAYMPKYRYDSTSKLCVRFIYGGCGGTENQFGTLRECFEFCGAQNAFVPPSRCSEKHHVTHDCDPTVPQFFYDNFEETCRNQRNGQCAESNNKFDSIEDCNKLCMAPTPAT